MSPDVTKNNPDLAGFDLEQMDGLGAWHDGSGGGIYQLAYELRAIRETEERIALLRAFIRKYQMILARLSWSADVDCLPPVKIEGVLFVPEIELTGYVYDKKQVTPRDVAALWPEAKWQRSMPRYTSEEDTVRDYTAEIDGVTVRIKNAEKVAVVKVSRFPACGPIGRIAKRPNHQSATPVADPKP